MLLKDRETFFLDGALNGIERLLIVLSRNRETYMEVHLDL